MTTEIETLQTSWTLFYVGMAGNDWINGYLEAILDVGEAYHPSPVPARIAESNIFNPTKYFVEEVVGGFDESDIHRSWLKATAIKNVHERNIRLENMCWRIWHLARKKKQVDVLSILRGPLILIRMPSSLTYEVFMNAASEISQI
ncbi:hypothetical protein KP509_04G026800 [Ceratopteris richardii]|uniref:Nitrogen regulatory protein areA GATA-like domain-containing protein n=1 Tax=Ceratopteris richardii TaxID=49495 RepID=A0A8T2UYP0_CERRI|nr:hypothetical protein KP509_04G026800 [Ceratopteris richardii]